MNYTNYLKGSMLPQRKQYIDALRGLSMIVVVYGHCLLAKSRTDYVAYFCSLAQSMLLCSSQSLVIYLSQRRVL